MAEGPSVLPPVRQWERIMTDSNKFVLSDASFDPELSIFSAVPSKMRGYKIQNIGQSAC